MKKYRIYIALVCLVAAVCVWLFVAHQKVDPIEPDQVEKIEVWVSPLPAESVALTAEESAKFIELYNVSKNGGQKILGESTPRFGLRVYFRDGTIMAFTDDFADLRVYFTNAEGEDINWYFVVSEELSSFVKELADNIQQTQS